MKIFKVALKTTLRGSIHLRASFWTGHSDWEAPADVRWLLDASKMLKSNKSFLEHYHGSYPTYRVDISLTQLAKVQSRGMTVGVD